MRKSDNSLHFFINGVNVGKQVKTIPPVLYGVVDVFGQAEEVTITGSHFPLFLFTCKPLTHYYILRNFWLNSRFQHLVMMAVDSLFPLITRKSRFLHASVVYVSPTLAAFHLLIACGGSLLLVGLFAKHIVFRTQIALFFPTGGTAETQSSNQDEVDSVSIMVRMHNIINIIKDGKFDDILSVVGKVAKDILEPYSETDNRQLRLKYGDHLSDISAPQYLTVLLRRAMDMGMETRAGWLGMYVIRSVFWNYADASLKMARDLGRSGSLKIMLNDLDTFGPNSFRNEVKPS